MPPACWRGFNEAAASNAAEMRSVMASMTPPRSCFNEAAASNAAEITAADVAETWKEVELQ